MKNSVWKIDGAWHGLRICTAVVGLVIGGCSRPLDEATAGQLLSDRGVAGEPVFCPTPLGMQGDRPWLWGGEIAARASEAVLCVDAVREHNVARLELMTSRDDGVAPSCLDDAYRAIVPVTGRSDVRGGVFRVRCGTMRVKITDVRTEGDVATIRYREELEVDRDALDQVSACKPVLPGTAPRDGEARALLVGDQWRLSR
ncbi:hypothetical protein [Sorangium sp. So ce1024]|uniref:hypothetical protein n=1 Tax=Sorangium sp. So ce1024 TaxID=3133327 RepID=UPI003F10CF15